MPSREVYKFSHWSDVDITWFRSRWPNFHPKELACKHCGELLIDVMSLDLVQRQRGSNGVPIILNSVYRCPVHNATVGGAPLSMHKFGRAFDQRIVGDRHLALMRIRQAGWPGIGLYKTFIHTDTGPRRQWFGGEGARKLWT